MMKWSNLKQNKCPNCNKDLVVGMMTIDIINEDGKKDVMIHHKCGFKIKQSRMTEIINDKVNKEILESLEEEYGQNN